MNTIEVTIAILVVLLIAVILPVSIWWKYPKYMRTYKWLLLISVTVFMFVIITLMDDENGLLEALLCTPVMFILGYLRFFTREKIAWGLYSRIQRSLSEDQKKHSRDHLRKLGVQFPQELNDKSDDE